MFCMLACSVLLMSNFNLLVVSGGGIPKLLNLKQALADLRQKRSLAAEEGSIEQLEELAKTQVKPKVEVVPENWVRNYAFV